MNRVEGVLRKLEASERPVSIREAAKAADQVSWNDIKEHLQILAQLVQLQRAETELYERMYKLNNSKPKISFPATPNEVGKYFNKTGKTIIRWLKKLKIRPPRPGGRISINEEMFEQIDAYFMKNVKY